MATAAQVRFGTVHPLVVRALQAVVLLAIAAASASAQAPTAVNDTYPVGKPAQGQLTPAPLRIAPYVGVLGNDTDPNQDPLSAVLVSNPSRGTLTLDADGSFVYTPGAAFVGARSDTFTYKAADATSQSATRTVTLTYEAGAAVFTGDVIRMRVDDTGLPSVWVAGVPTSGTARGFVYQYYGVNSWGTLLWIDGVGRFQAGFGGDPFTLVSNVPEEITSGSTVIGGRLVSTFDLGTTGLRLVQTFTYFNGNRYVTKNWAITNTSGSPTPELRLLHGGDTYFGGNDSAFGFFDPAKTMVYVRNNAFAKWGLMGFYANPATPASRYYEGSYDLVYTHADTEPPNYPDTVDAAFQDAGYGLQWNKTSLADGDTWVIEAFEVWTEGGSAQVLAPAAQNVTPATTVTLPFSVQNLGTTSTAFTLTSTTSAGWSVRIPEGTSVTLAQNASATVNVEVTVPAALANGVTSNVSLVASAVGVTASAATTVTVANLPVDISLPDIDFTAIVGGQQVVLVENTGNAPFTFGTIATQAPFGTTDDTCSNVTLAIAASCTVKVTFASGTSGTYSANLNIPVVSPILITRTIPLSASVGGPTAADDSYGAVMNTTLTVNVAGGVLANDSDPDPMVAVLAAAPQHGALTLNSDGSFQYVPAIGYVGIDTFTYRARNGAASSTAQTVTLTVAMPNVPPVAVADVYTVIGGTSLTVPVLTGVLVNDTDADLDPLTVVLVTGQSHGTLALNANGSFTYTPTVGFDGNDSFTYAATDGLGSSATVTVTITVSPGNVAPLATADTYITDEDTTLTVPALTGVLVNDTDADLDTLTVTLTTGPAHGSLALNPDGSFSYTPTADFSGADSFAYVAHDGTMGSATTTVTLTVTPVNDVPTLDQPAPMTARWDAGAQLVTLAGISAGGGETGSLTVTAVSTSPGVASASAVTYSGGSTATFILTPVVGQEGVVTVTVTVNDGVATTTRTLVVTVAAPAFYLTGVYPATGPDTGGTNVRISGSGFLQQAAQLAGGARAAVVAPHVLIGGVPVTAVVIESDTVISAITPALPAGTALTVRVVVPAGAALLPAAFKPYTRPTPPEPPTEPTDPTQPPADPTNPQDPTAPTTDTDGDGMPNVWEEFYGTDPNDAGDAQADPDGDGRTNKAEFQSNDHPDSRATRYFAEGHARAPFRTWVNIYNPSPIEAAINITFYLDDATVVHHLVKAPGGARTTVDASNVPALDGHAFGMKVDADETVVVNRTITWNEQGTGAAAERGVELSSSWYFAEGATHANMQTFVLLTNPADQPATVEIEYLVSAEGMRVMRTHLVPAHARYTVWVNQEGAELADQGFGLVVRGSHPIVAERATYITAGAQLEAGETSVGAPTTGTDWYFAEGVAGPVFNTFLLLANPTDTAAEVQVRYLPESGAEVVTSHIVGPYGRVTIAATNEASWDPQMGFGMHAHVTNGVGIVAERAMWWSTDADTQTWEEGHGSAGSQTTATRYGIGDGVAGGAQGASTYVLIANPGATPAQVRVTLAFEDGSAPVAADLTVDAGRRVTVDVRRTFPAALGRRFSAKLESLNNVPFVAEQSMYWTFGTGNWKSGVSLPATRLP